MKESDIKKLDFPKMGGAVPAIVQDVGTKAVLMLGFMNKKALEKTLRLRKVVFWSRTKNRLWEKGEVSGNKLDVVSIHIDCDNDTLLFKVKPQGPTCHKGTFSCFNLEEGESLDFLLDLYNLLAEKKKIKPTGSYTASLFNQGLKKILGKIKEESREVVTAAQGETKKRTIEESVDLLYHLMVLFVEKGISFDDLLKEFKRRRN